MIPIHPAIDLAFQVWAWIAGIWFVLWVASKITRANRSIEQAKDLPGGLRYQEEVESTEVEYEADEELGYRAHA